LQLPGGFFGNRVDGLVERIPGCHPRGGPGQEERQELPGREKVGDQEIDGLAERGPASGDLLLGVRQ
jgi:hypothetical protein